MDEGGALELDLGGDCPFSTFFGAGVTPVSASNQPTKKCLRHDGHDMGHLRKEKHVLLGDFTFY
jgi:hypothetical protein